MRLAGLDLKNPPEQILVGLDPQEGLADDYKACQLQHHVRRKMLQLYTILTKEAAEEIRRRNRESTLMEVGERHHLVGLWERNDVSDGRPPPRPKLFYDQNKIGQYQAYKIHN